MDISAKMDITEDVTHHSRNRDRLSRIKAIYGGLMRD